MAPERLEWITERSRFDAVADAWDSLAAGGGPFDRHAWFGCWWQAFGRPGHMRVAALWRGERLVAAFPLIVSRGRARAWANEQSPGFRPLAADDAAREAVVRAAAEAGRQQLVVPALAAGDPALLALRTAAARPGRVELLLPARLSPVVDTEGSWAEYRRRMKSKWGSVERKSRKMRREYDASFAIVEAPSDPDAQLARAFDVERSGWKGRAGTAIADVPGKLAFYRALGRAFAGSGQLRLSEIVLDGRLAAFDLALLDGGRLFSLQTGYDESFARLSPGLVLRREMIERCFELGLEAHELLGHDLPWKRRFATSDRQYYELRCYGPHPLARVRYGYHRSARPVLKRTYRRLQPRLGPARGAVAVARRRARVLER